LIILSNETPEISVVRFSAESDNATFFKNFNSTVEVLKATPFIKTLLLKAANATPLTKTPANRNEIILLSLVFTLIFNTPFLNNWILIVEVKKNYVNLYRKWK